MQVTTFKCEMCGANVSPKFGSVFVDCAFCGCTVAFSSNQENNNIFMTQTVFAIWNRDKYYYPATIIESYENHAKVLYLDGDSATVLKTNIISLQDAFKTLRFEGNWQEEGWFYKGHIASYQPLIMNYNDGDVEQISMRQLRGK